MMWGILALEKTDHDLLVELCTKMDLIHTILTNHLEHHFVYNMTLLGALLSLGVACFLYLLKSRKLKSAESRLPVTDQSYIIQPKTPKGE